ncbi:hypothetical protein [Streptomyces sp. PCS3-D2]|nr:hypothetical protein [Streptomyces sp. PCS3-D2]
MSLDTPDAPGSTTAPLTAPSEDLLERARVGWSHCLGDPSEASDE